MAPRRLTAIAFRWSIFAAISLCLFTPDAQGQKHKGGTGPTTPASTTEEYAYGACSFLTRSQAESILGARLQVPTRTNWVCYFFQVGFVEGAGPNNKQVKLEIEDSSSPDPDRVNWSRGQIAKGHPAPAVVRDVADFADAAIWTWTPGWGGTLHAFKNGTIAVRVTIGGIGQDDALQNAKAVATRALHGASRTGYVYLKPGQVPAPTVYAPAKGLVRKSEAYWGAYNTDIVRLVFDGNFSSNEDDSSHFRLAFNTYVESFSNRCRAYLPPQHESVTVTQMKTRTDRLGNVVREPAGAPVTYEVDSRFASKYREYTESVSSGGRGLASTFEALSGKGDPFAPGTDVVKFFAKESCQSASMRQLGENFLRAATGTSSLQAVNATIPGAAAESDKSLPPGRFTRFLDGCIAYYRAPHPYKHYGSREIEWCQCLAERYKGVMTSEEQARYGNDFEHLFLNGIAQPLGYGNSKSDPAWQRLHPAVDKCAR